MRRRNRANRQSTDAELIWHALRNTADAMARHDLPALRLAVTHFQMAVERRARGLAEAARLRAKRIPRDKLQAGKRRLFAMIEQSIAKERAEAQRNSAPDNGAPI